MSDDWDVYFCRVNDKPASILLDLGLGREAPLPGLSLMAYISLDFQNPDENGMSRREEYDRLMEIEDALTAALDNKSSLYVGRCTTNGQRDFFFYRLARDDWQDKVAAVMSAFPEYAWEVGTHDEPAWDTYLDFLFPYEKSMDEIQNNRVRRSLAEHGDDLSAPRSIDHWLYFPSPEDRSAFRAEAEKEGFTAHIQEEQEKSGEWCVRLEREDIPDELDDVTWSLRELAGARGGRYDGWGAMVVKS